MNEVTIDGFALIEKQYHTIFVGHDTQVRFIADSATSQHSTSRILEFIKAVKVAIEQRNLVFWQPPQ